MKTISITDFLARLRQKMTSSMRSKINRKGTTMKQLVYPSDDTQATLHRSLITICEQNHWVVILLNTLIHLAEASISEGDKPWIAITQAETILHLFRRITIGQNLQFLKQHKSRLSWMNEKLNNQWNHTQTYRVHHEGMQ